MATLVPLPTRRGSILTMKRVLIVDGHPTVGAVMAESLTSVGYHAVHCTAADEALRQCRSGLVDAVLIEVGLRTESGRSLATALSQDHPDLPVAVLTAWLDHPETAYIDGRGVRMVLRKPLRIEDLDLAVRALIDGFRTGCKDGTRES